MRQTGLILVLVLASTGAWAESYTGGENNNPFAKAVPSNGKVPESRSGDAKFFSNTNTIQDDSAGNDSNGREYKLNDATRQGGVGTAAATVAGMALTDQGMRELGMLNFPEAARLFGLAGLEFAQAGANAASAAANNSQRNTLLANADQQGAQSAYDPAQVAQDLLTPERRAALESKGIDPEKFAQSLTSGQVRSGSDAFAAMGKNPADFKLPSMPEGTPEDLGNTKRELIGMNEEAETNPFSESGSGAGGIGGLPSIEIPQSASAAASNKAAAVSTGSVLNPSALKSNKALSNSSGADALHGFKMPGLPGSEKEEVIVDRNQLLTVGVTKVTGQNIFKVANRNYRSFTKWRAMRKPKSAPKGADRDIASY